MSQRREVAYQAVLLAGSVILLGLSISRLPPRLALLKAPSTPFDRRDAKAIAPAYRLLSQAALLLPVGASVADFAVTVASPLPKSVNAAKRHEQKRAFLQ